MGCIIRTDEQVKNVEFYNCSQKAKSANKRFDDSISKWDILDVLERFEYRCFYCNEIIKPKKWQLDHYHPRAVGGKNEFNNLVCTCKWCNTMKNALNGEAFINKCLNVVNNNWMVKNIEWYEIIDRIETKRRSKSYKKGIQHLEKHIGFDNFTENEIVIIKQSIAKASGRGDKLQENIKRGHQ